MVSAVMPAFYVGASRFTRNYRLDKAAETKEIAE
jgi:hypothetical protein